MKSCVLFVFLGFAAISLAHEVGHEHSHDHGHDRPKVCVRASDECNDIKDTARGVFRNLRAIEIVEPAVDIPKYINQLHELFNLTLQTECTVNVCKCKDGILDCKSTRDDIRNILQHKVKLPECLGESEKATALLGSFRKAVADGDREALLAVLDDLHKAITDALAKGDNEKIVTCITKTVQHIREVVKAKVQQSDFQPTCDFCKA